MFPRLRSERGITIIETTVILSVLFILAGAMSPIVSESVNTARAVKAKSDAGMVAMALINFQKDLGADAQAFSGGTSIAEAVRLPDVLESHGSAPGVDGVDDAAVAETLEDETRLLLSPGQAGGNQRQANRGNMRAQRRQWREMNKGALDDHLTTNRQGYRPRRPGEYSGWAGPYISSEIKGDPWGNTYLINTGWLDGGSTPADAQGRTRRAVYVVSAGANGTIETPYDQPITDARAHGDDIVIRLQ